MISTPPDPSALNQYLHWKLENAKARFSEVDQLTCEQVLQPLSLHEMLSQSPLSRLDFESLSILAVGSGGDRTPATALRLAVRYMDIPR
jgi:hypothetical protein